jgi:hypothetical protein
MNTIAATTVAAIFGGLLVYGLLRWLLSDIEIEALVGIVGIAAVASASLAAWIARRRAGESADAKR